MKVAVIQLNAQADKKSNIAQAVDLVERAVARKAQWIALPEAFSYRGKLNRHNLSIVAEGIPGESTRPFFDLARKKKVFILAGSVCEKDQHSRKAYNTSILLDDKGRIAACYRKIHLFDAVIGKKVLKESKNFLSGRALATGKIRDFKVGLTICYDLRFPGLYQSYAALGCHALTVPSAFTRKTGQAHWEILLRARAIENLCYVLAPNQTGKDARGVASYGHSMMISPWGEVLARASGHKTEIIYGDMEMSAISQARAVLPAISN